MDADEKVGFGVMIFGVLVVLAFFAQLGIHPLVTIFFVGLLAAGGWLFSRLGL